MKRLAGWLAGCLGQELYLGCFFCPLGSVMFSIPHIMMKTAGFACCALPSRDVTFIWSVRLQASAAQIGTTTTSIVTYPTQLQQSVTSTSIYHGLRRPFYRDRGLSAKSLSSLNNITHISSPKRSPVPHRKQPSDHRGRPNRFWKNHTAATVFTRGRMGSR